jgi:hypothetical protein
MSRALVVIVGLLLFGIARVPLEQRLAAEHRRSNFRVVNFDLDLREQLGQLGFVAALSGFRSLVADALFIQAHVAWEQTAVGPRPVSVSPGDNAAAARDSVLGHGCLAHGLEREYGGDERPSSTAPGAPP